MIDEPETPTGASAAPLGPPCRHLRSKGMYVYTDMDPHAEPGDYDNTIFWCQRTLKDIGPDQGLVGRDDCREASRSCCESC